MSSKGSSSRAPALRFATAQKNMGVVHSALHVPDLRISCEIGGHFMRMPHPKIVEATGLAIILASAIWSATFIDDYIKKVNSFQSNRVIFRLEEIMNLVVVNDQARLSFLKDYRQGQTAMDRAVDIYKDDPFFDKAGRLRLWLASVGAVIVIISKFLEWHAARVKTDLQAACKNQKFLHHQRS